jgi:hypothetical protein
MAADGYPKYIDPANDPYTYLVAPNPPTAEAVAKAKPFRGVMVQKLEAIIKDPSYQIAE